MLYVWNMLRCRRVPILWFNGSYVTNFNSTASSGSDQRITRGNVRDGGDIQLLQYGNLRGYHRRGAIKEKIMKALCRDYKVDINSS